MNAETHACGGTILVGGAGEQRHHYCDRCHAFAYNDADVPDGTDESANREAWDNGDDESPAAEGETMAYQIQVRGDWGGEVRTNWRPAVTGTLNQTGRSDEEASTFGSHDEAQATLDALLSHMPDGEDDRDMAPKFRIVAL